MEVAMKNPYKNISVMRDTNDITKFPEKREFDLAYKYMMQENNRLQHLVQCLIVQLGKIGDKFPLKEIDKQMELFDKKHKPLYKGP